MPKLLLNNGTIGVLALSLVFGISLAVVSVAGAQTTPLSAAAPAPPNAPAAADAPTPGKSTPKSKEAPASRVPAEVVQAMLAGTPAGLERVRRYLVGEKLDVPAMTDRSVALVSALHDTPVGQDPQQLLAMANKVSEIVKSALASGTITRVTVDKRYQPGPNDRAWKFGPQDAETPPGFEKVNTDDPRLKGANLRGVHRPGGDPLTSSGIIGIRNFQGDLPNGQWRVMLITDDLGEPETTLAPLGQTVRVNATTAQLSETDPSNWLGRAYLSNQTIKAPEATGALKGLGVEDSVVVHQAQNDQGDQAGGEGLAPGDVASTTAGALSLNANVNDNRIGVSLNPPTDRNDQETYLVAVIAEPSDQPSAFQPQITTLDIQTKIFNEAINLTQPPTAGQPLTNQLQFLPTQAGQNGNTTLDVTPPPGEPSTSPT
jgi:hypothetical protein